MISETRIENENYELANSGIEFFVQNAEKAKQVAATSHIHSATEILYITKGCYDIYINNTKIFAEAGSMVLVRPNNIHSTFSLNELPCQYYVLKLKSSFLLEFADKQNGILYLMQLGLTREKQKVKWSKEEMGSYGMDLLWKKMINTYNEKLYAGELVIKANIILLIAEILKCTSSYDLPKGMVSVSAQNQIYKAMVYVNNNFDKNITVKDCALHVNMSYTYFSRLFKRVMGKSFSQYLTETRINHAEKEIFVSDKSITEICFSCGFNDTSYFISKYKELRGDTPYNFRKKYLEDIEE